MKREFTSTVYIFDAGRVLLIFHNKLKKWLPAGGHQDPNETPPETAIREALEETGLEIELIPQENIFLECGNAQSIPRPWLCLLEEIPEYKGEPVHQHVDMVYVARPIGGRAQPNFDEVGDMRWFSLEELELEGANELFFPDTLPILRALFELVEGVHCGK